MIARDDFKLVFTRFNGPVLNTSSLPKGTEDDDKPIDRIGAALNVNGQSRSHEDLQLLAQWLKEHSKFIGKLDDKRRVEMCRHLQVCRTRAFNASKISFSYPSSSLLHLPIHPTNQPTDLTNLPYQRVPPFRGKLVELEGSSVVFAEGDTGDAFYIIYRGTCIIQRNGHAVAKIERYNHFGEIALQSNAPRNATVLTEGPCQLVKLTAFHYELCMRHCGTQRAKVSD